MLISTIEYLFVLSWIINAFLFIPQALNIYRSKSANDVSLLTFVGFNFIQLFTLLHALIHDDYKLAFGAILSLITCGWVSFLIVYYRRVKPATSS